MKYMVLLLIPLLLLTACDTELTHESHDHDGDGEEDHAPEDHDEHDDELTHEEMHLQEIPH